MKHASWYFIIAIERHLSVSKANGAVASKQRAPAWHLYHRLSSNQKINIPRQQLGHPNQGISPGHPATSAIHWVGDGHKMASFRQAMTRIVFFTGSASWRWRQWGWNHCCDILWNILLNVHHLQGCIHYCGWLREATFERGYVCSVLEIY